MRLFQPDLCDRTAGDGFLLYGPPGCGKTMVAGALAHQFKDVTFYNVSAADINSKWKGESEGFVKQLFKHARNKTYSIIFLDECEGIFGVRSKGGDEPNFALTQFLSEWSGEQNANVLIIAATNIPAEIDGAILRRFNKGHYHIPLPNDEARKHLLLHLFEKKQHNLTDNNFAELVTKTEGFNCSDIKQIEVDVFANAAEKFFEERDIKSKRYKPKDLPPVEYIDVAEYIDKEFQSKVKKENVLMCQRFANPDEMYEDVTPKKVSPKKVSPKKASPKKSSPKKASPKKKNEKKASAIPQNLPEEAKMWNEKFWSDSKFKKYHMLVKLGWVWQQVKIKMGGKPDYVTESEINSMLKPDFLAKQEAEAEERRRRHQKRKEEERRKGKKSPKKKEIKKLKVRSVKAKGDLFSDLREAKNRLKKEKKKCGEKEKKKVGKKEKSLKDIIIERRDDIDPEEDNGDWED